MDLKCLKSSKKSASCAFIDYIMSHILFTSVTLWSEDYGARAGEGAGDKQPNISLLSQIFYGVT